MAEQYEDEAFQILDMLRNAGFFRDRKRVHQLETHADFASLRRRDEYHQLLRKITGRHS